jgi:acyl-coenzyme A synthetase/AMP-(fatty) acid ligase
VPISPTLAAYELKQDIERIDSIVIFTSVENAKLFDEIIENFNRGKSGKLKIRSVFVLDGSYGNYIPFDKLLEEGKNQILDKTPHFDVDPKNDIFLMLRSSGTSGLPKTAMISHHSFAASLIDYWTAKQFNPLIVSMIFPLGHIGGQVFLPVWLSFGATIVLLEKYDHELLLKAVEKYRINLLSLFPAIGHKLIKGELVDKYDLSSIKMMFTTGAAFTESVAKDIIKKYNVIFRECMYLVLSFFSFFRSKN